MQDRLVTVTEAIARLQINYQTLKKAFDNGTIHGVRTPGGRRRIYESEIIRLLAGNRPIDNTNESKDSGDDTIIAFGSDVWKNPAFQKLSIGARLFYVCALTYTSSNKTGGFISDQDLPEIAIESGILNYSPVVEELVVVDERCDFGRFVPAMLEIPQNEQLSELAEEGFTLAPNLPKSLWYKVEGGYQITGVATFVERFGR